MTKIMCYSCQQKSAENINGLIECKDCFSIRWSIHSFPTPSKRGSGIDCIECKKRTVFKIGLIAGAVVWQCINKKIRIGKKGSISCGFTYIESLEISAQKSQSKRKAILSHFSRK